MIDALKTLFENDVSVHREIDNALKQVRSLSNELGNSWDSRGIWDWAS